MTLRTFLSSLTSTVPHTGRDIYVKTLIVLI